MGKIAIAIHGGAGTIRKEAMTADREQAYQKALKEAINTGHTILTKGGVALDAVEAAVMYLEDNPLFNAGRGAVFTHEGKNELDASIMEGANLMAGAVAGVKNIKNPIQLAKRVITHSNYVMLVGRGAEQFAEEQGVSRADDAYFHSDHRMRQLERALKADAVILDHSDDRKYGTVGAVALDVAGNLAAATSTGGMTNKRYGRVGDSPVIGSGTYANNATCAVSCTGAGEFFLRSVVAYDISCLMEYKGLSLAEACELVVHKKLVELKGNGGLIAIDKVGNVQLSFNSLGMYRASKVEQEETLIGIYK